MEEICHFGDRKLVFSRQLAPFQKCSFCFMQVVLSAVKMVIHGTAPIPLNSYKNWISSYRLFDGMNISPKLIKGWLALSQAQIQDFEKWGWQFCGKNSGKGKIVTKAVYNNWKKKNLKTLLSEKSELLFRKIKLSKSIKSTLSPPQSPFFPLDKSLSTE